MIDALIVLASVTRAIYDWMIANPWYLVFFLGLVVVVVAITRQSE